MRSAFKFFCILSLSVLSFFSCEASVRGGSMDDVEVEIYDSSSWNGADSVVSDPELGSLVFQTPAAQDEEIFYIITLDDGLIEKELGSSKVIVFKNLAMKNYEFTCHAYSEDGTLLASGSSSVMIESGKTNSLNLVLHRVHSAVTYTITVGSFAHGNVSASRTDASAGSLVVLTVEPNAGYELEPGSISVTDSDGQSISLTTLTDGVSYRFSMPESNVSVSATFQLETYKFHSTVTSVGSGYNGTAGTDGTYVYFGDWPQTIKGASVTVDETHSITMGGNTYYLGNDGNYYAKMNASVYFGSNYSFHDGTSITDGSQYYFKVEPIIWRVLNPSDSGEKILLAESILTSGIPFFESTSTRTSVANTIYANNYEKSQVRAYLNGLSYSNASNSTVSTYQNKGFLYSAFGESARGLILNRSVDNSLGSIYPSGTTSPAASDYTCDNTSDKVFLMSVNEVTTTSYGFSSGTSSGPARKRKSTDYALATGAYKNNNGYGWWWLRSPYQPSSTSPSPSTCAVRTCSFDGATGNPDADESGGGICPAIRVSF